MALLPLQHIRPSSSASAKPLWPLDAAANDERAKAFPAKVPSDLSFEHVVRNHAFPPCSLSDFMGYMVYVDHNAELLQFFLWYCDYVDRWAKLLPRQKFLSPVWDPTRHGRPALHVAYSHRRAKSERMTKIISLMEQEARHAQDTPDGRWSPPVEKHSRSRSTASLSFPWAGGASPPASSPGELPQADWQPFTIQPLRDEVTRVVRHYIAESSPRQLNLTADDRAACLDAVQHTTHPSALLPAFLAVESELKGQQHPNFVHWSVGNSSRSRVHFVRTAALALALLGLALDAVLMLSRLSHFLRVLCLLLWWPGFTALIAAHRHICIVLHLRNVRHLRPWEQHRQFAAAAEPCEKAVCWCAPGSSHGGGGGGDDDLDAEEMQLAKPPAVRLSSSHSTASRHHHHHHHQTHHSHHQQKQHQRHTPAHSRTDSLRTFGPANGPVAETWERTYAARSPWRRIWEETVPNRHQGLQLLRGRAVFMAVLWGGLAATALTVGSLFVPNGNLFL